MVSSPAVKALMVALAVVAAVWVGGGAPWPPCC